MNKLKTAALASLFMFQTAPGSGVKAQTPEGKNLAQTELAANDDGENTPLIRDYDGAIDATSVDVMDHTEVTKGLGFVVYHAPGEEAYAKQQADALFHDYDPLVENLIVVYQETKWLSGKDVRGSLIVNGVIPKKMSKNYALDAENGLRKNPMALLDYLGLKPKANAQAALYQADMH